MKRFLKNHSLIIFILVIVLGLAARLSLALFKTGNFDMESYQIVVDILKKGGVVFTETDRYNYSPIWSYILLGLDSLANLTHLPFPFVERTFISFVDLFDAFLIGLIASQTNRRNFLIPFVIYFLNPIAILLSGIHGQFENLAVLPLLLAIYIYYRAPVHRNIYVWLLGTLSILIKQITLPGVWMLFFFMGSPIQAFVGLLFSGVIFVASFIPYLPGAANNILDHVFLYSSGHQQYGLSIIFPRAIVIILFIIFSVILPYLAKQKLKLSLESAMTFAFISFLVFTPGIAVQYFLLPVLFGSINGAIPLIGYSLLTTYFLAGNPDNLGLSIPNNWNIGWIACASWFIWFFLGHCGSIPLPKFPRIRFPRLPDS